ncbi:MAG: hypothetical protein EXR77_17125 [Myxococcales bacterium]|nr:hypothetical protein [Myxococcales bacterium]
MSIDISQVLGWGVLLAAGHGRRAGGPKALKRVNGELWWRTQALAMTGSVDHVVVVLHRLAWPDADDAPSNVTALVGDPDATQLASLQAALALVPAGLAALVLPVDCPWPGAAVATALLRAVRSDWLAVRPLVQTESQNRRGHPILLLPLGIQQVAALDSRCDRLDHWLASRGQAVGEVSVDSLAVLANCNYDGHSQ